MQRIAFGLGNTRVTRLASSWTRKPLKTRKRCDFKRPRCEIVKTEQRRLTKPQLTTPVPSITLTENLTIDKTDNIMSFVDDVSDGIGQDTPMQTTIEKRMGETLWDLIPKKVDNHLKVNLSGRTKGFIMLNLMTLIMSTNFVVVKDAEQLMDPLLFSAARFILAAIAFVPFFARIKIKKHVMYAGAELGAWSALGYLTQGIALQTTDASRISFLSALTVILVPLLVGFSGRKISKMAWGSAAAAMIGVFLLSGSGFGGSLSIGDLLGLSSAVFIAIQIIRTESFCQSLTPKDRFSAVGVSMISTAMWATILALGAHRDALSSSMQYMRTLTPETFISSAQALPAGALLYTSFVSTDIVLLLEVIALQEIQSTDAAIIYTVEPVLGALWAYILLGERWGSNGWYGAAMILASSFLTQIYGSKEEQEP